MGRWVGSRHVFATHLSQIFWMWKRKLANRFGVEAAIVITVWLKALLSCQRMWPESKGNAPCSRKWVWFVIQLLPPYLAIPQTWSSFRDLSSLDVAAALVDEQVYPPDLVVQAVGHCSRHKGTDTLLKCSCHIASLRRKPLDSFLTFHVSTYWPRQGSYVRCRYCRQIWRCSRTPSRSQDAGEQGICDNSMLLSTGQTNSKPQKMWRPLSCLRKTKEELRAHDSTVKHCEWRNTHKPCPASASPINCIPIQGTWG